MHKWQEIIITKYQNELVEVLLAAVEKLVTINCN